MIGNELGAGNLEKGKRYGIRLLKISFACGIFASLLMCISAPIILHFVKLTPQAQEYLKGMFAVIAFYMIGRAVNDVTINGIFGAGGDTLFDMYSLAVYSFPATSRIFKRQAVTHSPQPVHFS